LKFYEILQGKKEGLTLMQIDQKESASLFDVWNEKDDKQIY